MRVLIEIENVNVVQLDVQVLVDRLERAADSNVVFELDRDHLVCKGLEEAGR